MRHLLVGSLAACLAVACLATPAEGQRGAPDNPYPQTLNTPVPAPRTKTAVAKFHADSLRAAFPVSSANEACWRYSEPDKVHSGDAGFCVRDRGEAINTALQWGALRTYYRGKWGNVVAVWTNAKTPSASIVSSDGTATNQIAFGIDSSTVRH